jgi:hypothetical protein
MRARNDRRYVTVLSKQDFDVRTMGRLICMVAVHFRDAPNPSAFGRKVEAIETAGPSPLRPCCL